jgi:hypothetical protein
MPQPPYSPDLAPSGFYLFSTVKEKLERIQLAYENQSFESLQAILSGLDHKELNVVFGASVQRVPAQGLFCQQSRNYTTISLKSQWSSSIIVSLSDADRMLSLRSLVL